MENLSDIKWPEGITTEIFVRDYWQQKPLLIRQAFPDFENPITPDEFCGLTMDEDFASRLIRLGEDKKWRVKHGPFSEDELTTLPKTDWSILITDMDKTLPDFGDFLEPFKFIPSWRIDDLMISYAPTGASVGAHTDAYDVFLFQASGNREWSITQDPDADLSYIPDQEIRILENFKAQDTWVLEPGDMLYLPPGVPHHGVSMDNECMTWSVGFRAPTHVELVSDMALTLEARIPEELRYADPCFQLQDNSGEVSADAIKRFRNIWDSYMNPTDEDFARMIGESLTRHQGDEEEASSDGEGSSIDDCLAASDEWEVSGNSRMVYVKNSAAANVTLFANGQAFACSEQLATCLTGSPWINTEELRSKVSGDADETLIVWLIDNDILRAE